MKRRDFLKATGAFAAHLVANSMILTPTLIRQAQAATGYPLNLLRAAIPAQDALLLVPSDKAYAAYNIDMNLRTKLNPQIRVLCRTAQAVAATINWAKTNSVPFAIRGGGHSYEGFSQSTGVVIDGRAMNGIEMSLDSEHVTVGAGCALGDIYSALAKKGRVIPAGSCPTVGVAGHVLGGGFGLLGRDLGLACDSLKNIEIVDAQGRILNANESENADLFWALRGGGNGSFGVATKFVFQTHPLKQVSTCGVSWVLPIERALKVMKAWQEWAPHAPDAITTIFRVGRHESGQIALRCAGQSANSESSLKAELAKWVTIQSPIKQNTMTSPFIDAAKRFGGTGLYEAIYMKGKSDYMLSPMSDEGIMTLMQNLQKIPTGSVVAICDAYGGAVSKVGKNATAFHHREALYSIQYYSQWSKAKDTPLRLGYSRQVYEAMRPFVSGLAYVNYSDLDLKNYAEAYWGNNLPRLQELKNQYDPENLFRHAQSVPSSAIPFNGTSQ